jgi:hypothetical protein
VPSRPGAAFPATPSGMRRPSRSILVLWSLAALLLLAGAWSGLAQDPVPLPADTVAQVLDGAEASTGLQPGFAADALDTSLWTGSGRSWGSS